MKYLVKRLREILEIDNPKTEADRKLVNTVMLVNKVPTKIKSFDLDNSFIMGYICNDFTREESCVLKVEDLDVYTPEPGTYISRDKEIVLLEKIPKRIWYKSYHEAQYEISKICSGNISPKNYGCDFIYNHCIKKDLCVDKRNRIFFWNIHIGNVQENNKIQCTNPLFKQELIDWERRGCV